MAINALAPNQPLTNALMAVDINLRNRGPVLTQQKDFGFRPLSGIAANLMNEYQFDPTGRQFTRPNGGSDPIPGHDPYEGIYPYTSNPIFPKRKINGEEVSRKEQFGNMYDLYKYWAGEKADSGVLRESKYKPTQAKDPNAKYVSIDDPEFRDTIVNEYRQRMDVPIGAEQFYKKGLTAEAIRNEKEALGAKIPVDIEMFDYSGIKNPKIQAIGNHTIGSGVDERGKYVSYYDVFDPLTGKPGAEGTGSFIAGLAGKPYEIYDRIHVKDYGKDKGEQQMFFTDSELTKISAKDLKNPTVLKEAGRELENRGLITTTDAGNTFKDIQKALVTYQLKQLKKRQGK
jgi:hypothetical protein